MEADARAGMTAAGGGQTAIEAVLRRYLEIQAEEQSLKDEKSELQARIAEHMGRDGRNAWYPEIDGRKLKVRYNQSVVIDYDEDLLRERLQERYPTILAPDIRKIRKAIEEIEPLLQPMADRIGTPSADRVRSAIEQGSVDKKEFAGAFTKTVKHSVAVGQVRESAAEGGNT